MRKEFVAVAATSADGTPFIGVYETNVTEDEYNEGIHYDDAIGQAIDEGYEGTFKCFDNSEHGAILAAAEAIRKLKAEDFIK